MGLNLLLEYPPRQDVVVLPTLEDCCSVILELSKPDSMFVS